MNTREKRLHPIHGLMPDPTDLPPGCPFAPRCSRATEKCSQELPVLRELSPGHLVRCIHMDVEA